MTLIIDLPCKVSTNVFYNMHFHKRHDLKQEFYTAVLYAARKAKIAPITHYPVNVTYSFTLPGRALDTLNLGAMAKMVEDGLRHAGVLKDDSPLFVSQITLSQRVAKKKECVVEVLITPCK